MCDVRYFDAFIEETLRFRLTGKSSRYSVSRMMDLRQNRVRSLYGAAQLITDNLIGVRAP